MTDAAIYQRVSVIRDELLSLISAVGARGANGDGDRIAELMLDDLQVVANGLGRVEEGLSFSGRSMQSSGAGSQRA